MSDNGRTSAIKLERTGEFVLRYGLVLVIFWIGCLKFTAYEAKSVQMIASNSPLLAWAYGFLDTGQFSMALGVVEIVLAVLIAMRTISPKASAIGSLGAIVMFFTTLSFLLTTPGVWQPDYGFPALSGNPGQFLIKDVVLLGVAIWSAGEALLATSGQSRATSGAATSHRVRTST